ncbi:uncharacterized protein LOC130443559 isoform X2 [Diorhabda sublineata]|uniref:uncharacterized protein LOC130443559 isoform X2 n=1 Tax=Diorhabda sublineata TaxID=1163346 RepID=UPI0024E11129|nr:uncharacterized protein LOC130443559 isoform X2 [Diorhabda sublineata]
MSVNNIFIKIILEMGVVSGLTTPFDHSMTTKLFKLIHVSFGICFVTYTLVQMKCDVINSLESWPIWSNVVSAIMFLPKLNENKGIYRKFSTTILVIRRKTKRGKDYFKIFVFFISTIVWSWYISSSFVYIYVHKINFFVILTIAFWFIVILRLCILILIFSEISSIVCGTYINVNNSMKKVFVRKICFVTIFDKRIRKMRRDIMQLHQFIDYVNRIFGQVNLLLFVETFHHILLWFCYFILLNTNFSIQIFVLCIILTMFSVIVILSCDRVEKKAEELIKTCIYIQASTGDENALALANLAKELRPKFSAAGFFDINQRILPSFFSNLSTYLIIILQFKLSSL